MRDNSVGRRRQFLFGAGAASVTAAAALVVAKPPAAVRPAAGRSKSATGIAVIEIMTSQYNKMFMI